MQADNIHLTEAEWAVMEYLWSHAPQTGREISDGLGSTMDWNRSTTLTLLRRLEAKGAVSVDSDGPCKRFLPRIGREEIADRETRNFLDRVYQGSLSLLVSSLTRKQNLSQKEIDELYGILQDLEVRQHE